MRIDLDEEILKREFILDIDEFGNTKNVDNIVGLARNIQSLIFLEPKTYPNHPEMGIGIKNYSFEFFDTETINKLHSSIKDQIRTYIPDNKVEDIVIQELPSNNPTNVIIGIMFILDQPIDARNDFIILLNQVRKTSKVISEIFI